MAALEKRPSPSSPSITGDRSQWQFLLNLAILTFWLWLYHPVFAYLSIIFSEEDFRTNQIVLLAVLALLLSQLRQHKFDPAFLHRRPRLSLLPLALVLGGSAAFLLTERFLNVNTLSATLFALGSYGLLGLWLSPERWRAGLPVALLLVGVLPFGHHLQTFVGYPMRIATAALIQHGLQAVGVASVGVDTILIFENGVSQVDLPCSGVQSLWTGALFLLAATWLERRPLSPRWFLIALTLAGLLFVANLARVAILIVTGPVLGWTLLAEMLHVPLGVLGFVLACGAALLLLRRLPLAAASRAFAAPSQPTWLGPALLGFLILASLLYTPRPVTAGTAVAATWHFPAELTVQPLPLTAEEWEWLTRDGAESADRFSFAWGDLRGSMILISSSTWRAHHRPERCFEVYGLSLEESRTHLVRPDFPTRFVSLGDGKQTSLVSATYWFQSSEQSTDDYATRIWADLAPQRTRWVLVSVLFDGVIDPQDGAAQAFYEALQQAVAGYLQ